MRWIFCVLIFGFFGCNSPSAYRSKIIHIQPLGLVDSNILRHITNSLRDFYKTDCTIEKEIPLSDSWLAESKTRYEAGKLLSNFNSTNNTVLILEKDIAAKNKRRNRNEWGIFGLGTMPGHTCVISTFRLKRNANDSLFRERVKKICIHEVGHNLGLPHCTSDTLCLMNDANGTIAQVDKEKMYLCKNCRKKAGM